MSLAMTPHALSEEICALFLKKVFSFSVDTGKKQLIVMFIARGFHLSSGLDK